MRLLYRILCFLLFLGISSTLDAQTIDYDTLIPSLGNPQIDFEVFLVQLGWANAPENKVFQYELKKTRSKHQLAKLDWFKDVAFAVNLNENNISKQEASSLSPIFDPFPRWNIQASINLGRIIERPIKIDLARDDIFIAKAKLNEQKVKIRGKVLKQHLAYKHTLEILKIRKQFEEDASQNYILVNNRFRQGTAPLDDLNRASSSFERAKEATLNAEGSVADAKLDLEILIGVTLEYAAEIHANVISSK